jgi:hypothetical protein
MNHRNVTCWIFRSNVVYQRYFKFGNRFYLLHMATLFQSFALYPGFCGLKLSHINFVFTNMIYSYLDIEFHSFIAAVHQLSLRIVTVPLHICLIFTPKWFLWNMHMFRKPLARKLLIVERIGRFLCSHIGRSYLFSCWFSWKPRMKDSKSGMAWNGISFDGSWIRNRSISLYDVTDTHAG